MRTNVLLSLTVLSLCGMSCSDKDEKKKGKASVELATVPSRAMALRPAAESMGLNVTAVRSSAVTITSLKVPIHLVSLAGDSDGGGYIYECSGTTDEECQVELVGTDLTNLLSKDNAGGEVRAGLVDGLAVYYAKGGCDGGTTEGTSGKISFTAKTTFKGETYYTKSTGELSTSGPAEAIAMNFAGCGTGTPVSPAIDIPEGGSVTLRAFMDITNMAYMQDFLPVGYSKEQSPNCLKVTDKDVMMCISAPDIGVTIDTGTPKVERYVISYEDTADTEGCGGLLGLFVDSTGKPFGGYLRNYWFESQLCGNLTGRTDARISTFSENADGTFKIADGFDNGLPPPANNSWPNFKRADHTGTMKRANGFPATTENTVDQAYTVKTVQ